MTASCASPRGWRWSCPHPGGPGAGCSRLHGPAHRTPASCCGDLGLMTNACCPCQCQCHPITHTLHLPCQHRPPCTRVDAHLQLHSECWHVSPPVSSFVPSTRPPLQPSTPPPARPPLSPLSTRSRTICALPLMARPTRHVRPMMRPVRLRMQLMRCSVRSMPARLSPPNSPTCTCSGPQAESSSHAHVSSPMPHVTSHAHDSLTCPWLSAPS